MPLSGLIKELRREKDQLQRHLAGIDAALRPSRDAYHQAAQTAEAVSKEWAKIAAAQRRRWAKVRAKRKSRLRFD